MESVKRMDGAKRIENLVDRLAESHILSREEFCFLLDNIEPEQVGYLYGKARKQALASYGNRVFVRGLIEFTNYCKNDCYYCGIRRSNQKASRYRLTPEQVMDCCHTGYGLGFRTFVLQGGEDPWFSDQKIAYLVERIRSTYPDCAITLSVGEKEYDTYKMWFDAGADRYLAQEGMSGIPKENRLPDRLRHHGGRALPDNGTHCGGFGVYVWASAPDGGDRPVHPAP